MRAPIGPRFRLNAVSFLMGLATLSVAVLPSPIAAAATDTVTTCASSGSGSLPAVVAGASAGDTVTFAVSCPPSAPIVVPAAIILSTDLSIAGPGASSLAVTGQTWQSSPYTTAAFEVPTGVSAAISGITIENSDGADPKYAADNPGGIQNDGLLTLSNSILSGDSAGYEGNGGAIANQGLLTVTDSTFSANLAGGEGGGGAIWNDGGVLDVTESTFSGNGGGNGGAISNDGGTVNVSDSTLVDNDAYDGGGVGGAINNNDGTLNVSDSTVSGNTALVLGFESSGEGGGIANIGGAVNLVHTTLWDNTSLSAGGDLYNAGTMDVTASIMAGSGSSQDCAGTLTDLGYDIDDDGTCGLATPSISDSPTLDAALGPLADNGGGTETMALLAGSPAVGLVTPASLCFSPDQRGVGRLTPCDSGAYEATDVSQVITFTSTPPVRAVVGGPHYTVAATGGASGIPVTFAVDALSTAVCAIAGTTVSFLGAGSCILDANQAGNDRYAPAPQVQQSFTVVAPAPTVRGVRPAHGRVGRRVTIRGTNLSGATAVMFRGTSASITSDTATQITTKVPVGARSGTIRVTTPGGTAVSTTVFKVT
jgi:hypothetical protein